MIVQITLNFGATKPGGSLGKFRAAAHLFQAVEAVGGSVFGASSNAGTGSILGATSVGTSA